jgi:hypothetical protein
VDGGVRLVKVFFNPKTGDVAVGTRPPSPEYVYLHERSFTSKTFSAYCPEHKMYEPYTVPTWSHSTFVKYADYRKIEWVERWGCSTATILFWLVLSINPPGIKIDDVEFCKLVEKMTDKYGEKFVKIAESTAHLINRLKYPYKTSARNRIVKAIMSGDIDRLSEIVSEIGLKLLSED